MKKILALIFLCFVSGGISPSFADDASSPVSPPSVAQDKSGQLVDLMGSRTHDDLEDLKRRVSRLEQDLRFLDQKVDGIARDVEDIRRRHLRS